MVLPTALDVEDAEIDQRLAEAPLVANFALKLKGFLKAF